VQRVLLELRWALQRMGAWWWWLQMGAKNGACHNRVLVFVLVASALLTIERYDCTSSLSLRGPTLKELSEILISRGALFAVNMDGGGSSVMVGQTQDNTIKVLSRPTCWDVDVQCERPVATVVCMK
jgi:Phosphodiester glycosidase